MASVRPAVVGIACMHALEIDDVRNVVARVRRRRRTTMVVVGGHSAAAYPAPFFDADVNAICLDDGERGVPALVDALAARTPFERCPRLAPQARHAWQETPKPDIGLRAG